MSSASLSLSSDVTPEQVQLLKNTVARGCSDDELKLFLHVCKTRRVDPFSKLIYPVKRWDRKLGAEVMALQCSIDSFRLQAERTGKYAGQLGPQWCGTDGVWKDVWLVSAPPAAARVGVLRKDFSEPLWTVALWTGYVQTDKNGNVAHFWARMGPLMLAKCAEALSLRRAFPEDLAGLYVAEEMEQAETARAVEAEVVQTPAAPKTLADLAAPKAPPPAKTQEQLDLEKRRDAIIAATTGGTPIDVGVLDESGIKRLRAAVETGEADARDKKKKAKAQAPSVATPATTAATSPGAAPAPAPSPPIHRWKANASTELEVPFAVKCGPWAEWCDQPIPQSKLSERAHSWRIAAQGKKSGGRHALLLDAVMRAQKALDEGRGITEAHMRAACSLQVLLAQAKLDPADGKAEQGALPFG